MTRQNTDFVAFLDLADAEEELLSIIHLPVVVQVTKDLESTRKTPPAQAAMNRQRDWSTTSMMHRAQDKLKLKQFFDDCTDHFFEPKVDPPVRLYMGGRDLARVRTEPYGVLGEFDVICTRARLMDG